MRDELTRGDGIGRTRLLSRLRRVQWSSVGACVLVSVACGPAESTAPGVTIDLQVEPSPPVVGEAGLSLRLISAPGTPLAGARVRVEGNMNHAGMGPTFADLTEVEPGRYTGTLHFTMAGDWILLVKAKMPDGDTLDRKVDVPGVRPR